MKSINTKARKVWLKKEMFNVTYVAKKAYKTIGTFTTYLFPCM